VRYLCTIYTREYTFGGKTTFGTEPSFESPWARVEVTGQGHREAAARAYVQCVGKQRARLMRRKLGAPSHIVAQETNRKAIAASLRKVTSRIGECFEMDNFVDAWLIKVQPVNAELPRPRRLSLPVLLHLSRSPSPN
jgi:hypothetical protein